MATPKPAPKGRPKKTRIGKPWSMGPKTKGSSWSKPPRKGK